MYDGCTGEATQWEFICLLPLFDPPRHDTQETIEKCKEKGISVKMVTGDQLLIGKETARQLGMGTDMYSTEVLLSVRLEPFSWSFSNRKDLQENTCMPPKMTEPGV